MMEQTLHRIGVESTDELLEKDDIRLYCDSFSIKREYYKEDLTKEIRNLFESCNVNFLIGSGYCYEKLKTLGNLELLIEENSITHAANNNKKNVIEALILYDFFRNSIFPHKQDIETNSSFENSNRFILRLAGLLSNRNDKNLLKRVNIFTTNYDLYFELSLETNKINYNDGFSGRLAPTFSTQNFNKIVKQIVQNTERESQIPTVNLFKIHGSLTWSNKSNQIVYRSTPEKFLQTIEDKATVFEDCIFNYDKSSQTDVSASIKSLSKVTTFSEQLLGQIQGFRDAYQELHIINPTKKKFEETLLSNVYYDLLRMYSNELEKNNSVLFVFGFSFKDEHLLSITKRALSNPSMLMYLFIFNETDVDEFKKMFKDHHNVYYIYYENMNIDLIEFTSIIFGD